MTRARIESLLASFPKLIPAGSQHTSIETPEVRYVYQPLEELYILLITNKASNILQDIDTLHLFARVVSDLCRSAEEREILKNSFELLGAFDEIVSLGYREQINLMQVRNVLEMESHEEKIQEIIARVCHHFLWPSLAYKESFSTEQGSGSKGRAQTPCEAARDAATRRGCDGGFKITFADQIGCRIYAQTHQPEPDLFTNFGLCFYECRHDPAAGRKSVSACSAS